MSNKKIDKWSTGLGVILIFFSALGFSAKSILVKLSFQEVKDPILILTLRMLFSLPFFLFGIISQKNKITFELKIYLQIFILGILGYYLASIFDFFGLEYISAAQERIILFTYPTIVVIFSIVIFKRKIFIREIISILLTYGGILIIFFGEDIYLNTEKIKGSIWVFMAALSYAGYLLGSGKLIPTVGASLYTSLAMTIAVICIFIHFILLNPIELLFKQSANIYLLSLIMAIFSTVMPAFFFITGYKKNWISKICNHRKHRTCLNPNPIQFNFG